MVQYIPTHEAHRVLSLIIDDTFAFRTELLQINPSTAETEAAFNEALATSFRVYATYNRLHSDALRSGDGKPFFVGMAEAAAQWLERRAVRFTQPSVLSAPSYVQVAHTTTRSKARPIQRTH